MRYFDVVVYHPDADESDRLAWIINTQRCAFRTHAVHTMAAIRRKATSVKNPRAIVVHLPTEIDRSEREEVEALPDQTGLPVLIATGECAMKTLLDGLTFHSCRRRGPQPTMPKPFEIHSLAEAS